jgi:Fe-S-cluster-containing hydrogenase component 2
MLTSTGIPTAQDLAAITPPEERFACGPVAVAECFQNIPCNPCVDACKRSAIALKDINDLPIVDFEKCNGCGACIVQCPGLAIFVVDKTYSESHAVVRLPYEFIPVPQKGQKACGMDRCGQERGWFEVVKVTPGGKKNKTAVIWLAVPKELAMEIRAVKAGGFKSDD